MPLPKIYIARHGERLDFVDPTWYSKATLPHDPPLTETGEQQATDLGRYLSSHNIRHVFASPFLRCVTTAVNATRECTPGLVVNIEPGACEWLNEVWYEDSGNGPEWRPLQQLKERFDEINFEYQPIFSSTTNKEAFPETWEQLIIRCTKVLDKIKEKVQDGNVLIVGHGSSVDAFYQVLCGPERKMHITYCCLTECIPNEDGSTYETGLFCEDSFLTQPQNDSKIRFA